MIRYSRLRNENENQYYIDASTNEQKVLPLYATSSSVAISEFGKMWVGIIAVFYEIYQSNKHTIHTSQNFNPFREFSNIIFGNFGTFLLMSVPSIVYGIQNNLLILALHHLDSSIYQITYQCKTFSAALFAMFWLNKSYNKWHWLSFCLLAIGAASASYSAQTNNTNNNTNTTNNNNNSDNNENINNNNENIINTPLDDGRSIWIGLICIFVACILSGFAGTFMEAKLKDQSTSLFVKNIQLALFGCLTSLVVSFINGDFQSIILPFGFLHGFTISTWIVIISNIAGGYLVALILKNLGNMVKAFAAGTAVVAVVLGSWMFFDTPLSAFFLFGAFAVLCGNIVYTWAGPTTINDGNNRANRVRVSRRNSNNENDNSTNNQTTKPSMPTINTKIAETQRLITMSRSQSGSDHGD